MILPSIVTRDCKRARHFLAPGSPYNRRDKRVARRMYRRSLDQQVKRLQLDPARFDVRCFELGASRGGYRTAWRFETVIAGLEPSNDLLRHRLVPGRARQVR